MARLMTVICSPLLKINKWPPGVCSASHLAFVVAVGYFSVFSASVRLNESRSLSFKPDFFVQNSSR